MARREPRCAASTNPFDRFCDTFKVAVQKK
jgi:hypothetical protein